MMISRLSFVLLFIIALGAFYNQKAFGELQTTLSLSAPALGPGESDVFTATTISGPAGSTTSTLVNPYAGILRYVLSAGTGRFASLSGTRYGLEFDSFQIFQSFITLNFLTMVSSSTTCPGSGTYNWLDIRFRAKDAPRYPMDFSVAGTTVGGVLAYDPSGTPVFTSTSRFDLAGPTTFNNTYGFSNSGYGACSSGVVKVANTGTSVTEPLGRFFFGSNLAFYFGGTGNPIVSLLVPQQTLNGTIMSNLSKHKFSGLLTLFGATNSQTRAVVYLYPDASGTTYTLRTVDNFNDPAQYTSYGTLTCTTLNSPYNGFCSGTISIIGMTGTGNVVCELGNTSSQDIIACAFRKPDDSKVGGTIIATRSKKSLLSVAITGSIPNISPSSSTTIPVTITNLTGSQVTSLSDPSIPAEKLQPPFSNPGAWGGGGGTCGATLDGFATCTMNVTYNPSTTGTTLQTLRVAYNNQVATVNGTSPIIGAAGLTSIALSPNSASFAMSTSQQFTATATYSDASTQNITSVTSTWGSSAPTVATMSSSGMGNFIASGTTTLSATFAGVTGNFSTTVYNVPPNPTGLSVTGTNYTQIDLGWTSGGGITSAFQIAYKAGGTAPANCNSDTVITSGVVGNVTSYSITGLNPGTQYSFRVCAEGPVHGSLSSGITVSGTTKIPHTIFATQTAYRGGLGSIYFADYICQAEAAASGFSGVWKAVIGNDTVSAASRISLTETIYNTRSPGAGGIQVVSTAAAFWGAHSNTINYNAGGGSPGSGNVWTGATTTGTLYAGRTCTDWSTASASVNGQYGQTSVITTSWISANQVACNNLYSLYCINLQTASAAPPNPTGFSNYTLGPNSASFLWNSGGGTTAAYKMAYQTGGTAPANCNTGTVISAATLGVNPNVYNVTGLTANTTYSFRLCALNSDQSSVSSGVTATVTTLNTGDSVITDLSTRQVVLSTAAIYNGNLGSIYFADYICQAEANQAGLTGIWKSIISDGTTSALSRISIPGKVYNFRPLGSGGLQEIAANSSAFWASSANFSVNYNAGGTSPGSTSSWTGSQATGAINAGNHCTNWTTSSAGVNGAYGTNTNTGNIINSGNVACNGARSLYCTNQQSSSAAPANPSGFSTYILAPTSISFLWASGGGTTAGYKIAYQTGATAPATCSLGTIIGPDTIGLNASSYSVTGLTANTQYSFRLCAINSDLSSQSSGVTVTTTTLNTGYSPVIDLSSRQVIFATSSTRNGSIGGLYFADFICQSEANSAGLTGIWKSVLSDESTSASSRISIPGKVYNLRPVGSGGIQEIVPDSSAFWSSAAAYAVGYNAAGGAPGSTASWSGSTAAGAVQSGFTCSSWGSGSAAVNGRYGTNNVTGNFISTGNVACNGLYTLYCMNQQSSSAAPSDPTGFDTYTLGPSAISFIWSSGGGTTAGYKIAYQTGPTAPANCSTGTVISATTLGYAPTSYTVSGLSYNTQYSFRLCAVNSDQSSVSAGVTITRTTLTSGSSTQIDLTSRQVVFATSNLYNGAFGSLYFGDYICQSEADAASLTGVWKAILSDDSTSALSRISISGKVYNFRPLGSGGIQEIAADATSFWGSSAAYSVNYNAGGSSPGSTISWTGSLATGAIYTSNTCTGWTTSDSGQNGGYGVNTNTGNIINAGTTACNTTRTLYCTNQQASAAAPPDPSEFLTYTLAPSAISFVWASGGGTTASYKIAYQTGGTAPANCNSGTVINSSTLGVNPSSYTVNGLSVNTQYSFRLCALNSDQSQASAGLTVTATTLNSGQPVMIDLSTRQVVFATANTYRGIFGGIYFADFICQGEADSASLSGVWKAVISDETTSASSRISIPGKVYNMRPLASGGIQQVAANSASFWSSNIPYVLYYNAGGTTPGSGATWTGSTGPGGIQSALTCTNWTTNSASVNGRQGSPNTTGNFMSTATAACNNVRSLYCTNQQSASATPSNPASFISYSQSSSSIGFKWTNGGGTTAGYRIVYQPGATAPANCSSGTIINAQDIGINATSYSVTGLSVNTQYSFRLCATNSNQSAFSAGLTLTVSTLDSGYPTAVDYSGTQVVFVTTNRYTGGIGGLHYADWLCYQSAQSAGISGTWKAILSDESTAASSRLSIPGVVYNNRPLTAGGIQKIAADGTSFWTEIYESQLGYTASGTTPSLAAVWTGTSNTGGIQAGNTCTSWTSSSAAVNGRYGNNNNVAATSIISAGNTLCNGSYHLYCINLQSSAAAPSNPATFTTGTIGTSSIVLNWTSGGGTTAAYKIAYQTGATAPSDCVTGTVIPSTTLGTNPTTYTVTGLSPGTQYSFRLCSLNSDESSASAGLTVSATTTSLVTPANQTMFATTNLYTGAIGGLYFADYICQTEAITASLAGTWMAVLSDESTSAASRISLTTQIYNNRPAGSGGPQQISTNANFWSVAYSASPNYNAAGGTPGSTVTWTGSTSAGGINTGLTCSSWSLNSGSSNGRYGSNNQTTLANLYNQGSTACNTSRALYCIDRQTSAAAPSDPTGFSAIYKSQNSVGLVWKNGGGTTAAYKITYQTGGTAPANCNTGTEISASTLGINPTAYTVTGLSSSTQYSFRLCAANSDLSALSSGVTVTVTTQSPSGGMSYNIGSTQLIFATANSYRGSFGGIYFGDYICQSEAESAGMTGIWRAVLSSSTVTASSRINLSGDIYNLRDPSLGGLQKVTDSTNFWNHLFYNPVNYTSLGSLSVSGVVWTGATVSGGSDANTCLDWTSLLATNNGRYGQSTTSNSPYSTGNRACNNLTSLYCINQQSAAGSPPDPTGFTVYSTASTAVGFLWSSGGGTTAAYRMTYQTGATAPSDCNSGTIVSASTLGVAPTTYTVTGLSPSTQYSFRLCAYNSDRSVSSAGVTVTATTPASGSTLTLGSTQVVFATENTYTGRLGSLYFGDFACQSEAAALGLTGVWKAVLSSSATNASSRISLSSKIYNTRAAVDGGISQITDSVNFYQGPWSDVINFSLDGSPPGSVRGWTGTLNTGAVDASYQCSDWTSAGTSTNGRYAALNVTTNPISSNIVACNNVGSLYCTNQQTASGAPTDPTGFSAIAKGSTSINFTWASGGGTTAGYKLSYQSGGTAPADCNSGTVVSAYTLGVNPTSYTVTGLSASTQYSFRLCAVNSDLSSVSTGVTSTVTTNASGTTYSLGTSQLLFATSSTFQGGFGGIYFGDYACQLEAEAAGLTGVWKAIVSDGSNNVSTRLSFSGSMFNTRSLAAGGVQQITDGSLFLSNSAFRSLAYYTAAGGTPGSTAVWTGSTTAGVSSGSHCSNWTTSGNGTTGAQGIDNISTAYLYNSPVACNNVRSLWCTNQQTASAAPSNPSSFTYTSIGSDFVVLNWISGGGTTAAYKIAYKSGGTAPIDCNSDTIIGASTLGVNPSTYTVTGLSASTQYSFRLCAANSDISSLSSGSTLTVTTTSGGTSYNIGSTQFIFGTSSTYYGNFGGIYFADFICQAEAETSGLSGVWKAIIGDESTSAASRLSFSSDVYNLRPAASGGPQRVINGSDFFQNSTLYNTFPYTSSGSGPGSIYGWAGATLAGAVFAGFTCNSWTSGATTSVGSLGRNSTTTNYAYNTTTNCGTSRGLMCINQQTASAAPSNPTSFNAMVKGSNFITLNWASGGGTTAGYKIAYQTGATAPANCATGTIINAATLGVNPTSYTLTGLSSSTQYSFRICAINSDSSSVSSGTTVTVTTTGSGTTYSMGSNQFVFVTTNLYYGSFISLYYADYLCQIEAESAGLSGVWKALGSDSAVNANSRITLSGSLYNMRPGASGGVQRISDSNSFWNLGALSAPFNYNASGTAPGSNYPWTGTNAAGNANGTSYCSSWTSSISTIVGTVGRADILTTPVINTNAWCNTQRPLMCINQQSASATPSDPLNLNADFRGSDYITLTWNSGGGTTAAYKIAYQSGVTAPANCATGTIIDHSSISSTSTTYTITSLSSSSSYSFRLCALNSDRSAVSTGVTLTASTTASGTVFSPGSNQYLFTTNSAYAGNVGSLHYADFICNNEATTGGLSGTWRAVLGDGTSSVQSRISLNSAIYNTRQAASGGIQNVGTSNFLLDGMLWATQYYTASGTTSSATRAWTGSGTAGSLNAGQTCTNWTTTAGTGRSGTVNNTTSAWLTSANSNCTSAYAFYCMNQQTSPSAPTNPATFTSGTITTSSVQFNFTSGGGTTAGYKLAYQLGASAPANCVTGTVVSASTIGVNPTTYTVTGLTSATQYSFRLCATNSDQSSDSTGLTITASTI